MTESHTQAKAVAPKSTRVSHAKKKIETELPNISVVKLVPLAMIDIQAQIRTVFDEEGIQSLSEDIQARGLLQPVLLNPVGSRFTLIAGERRVRACVMAGLTNIPALVTKASSADALLMQLAENIQRENLDLEDEVNAIRQLHDSLESVSAVADTVKKSLGWVSKRLALSHPNLCWQARALMQDGVTEDVEILNAVGTLGEINYLLADKLVESLKAGTATRETARQMVRDAKAYKKAPPPAIDKTEEKTAIAEIKIDETDQENDCMSPAYKKAKAGYVSTKQQLHAKIIKSSKYYGQGEKDALFEVYVRAGAELSYVVQGGPGGQYRLSDVHLYIVDEGREMRIA